MLRTWSGVGGGQGLHIERKITSVVHSHPPSHYIRTHAFCAQHDYWWCLFTTRRFHKSHLLIHTHAFRQIISSLGIFFWERSTASHFNLQERCTQDAFYLRKHTESGKVSATHVSVQKRYGIREQLVAGLMNLRSQGRKTHFTRENIRNLGGLVQRAFFIEKHNDFFGGWREWYINLQSKWSPGACFMRNSPGLAGVACKFTVKMKARRFLHEKTQRFLRGRQEWHVNLQSKWRPRAFYMRKHNDFSAVGARAHFTWENTTISPRSVRAHFTWENTTISPRSVRTWGRGVY